MTVRNLMIANRGEIAMRVARTARDLGLGTATVYSEDDADCRHLVTVDRAVALEGRGAAAYLDAAQILAAAEAAGCDAVHPGYGFLSENAVFARACADRGLTFVGPRPEQLELFGDKARGRELAQDLGIPTPAGTEGAVSLEDAQAFFASLGSGAQVMVKALAGGGGRGMRMAASAAELEDAFRRCQSEAMSAFGDDAVYLERLVRRAWHIEVQIAGDGVAVIDLGERDCTLQRRRQKLIEIAPSPHLTDTMRADIIASAIRMASAVGYQSLGTFEFLVDRDPDPNGPPFVFIEANPRIQVEHTVTEEVTGRDLVEVQLRLAGGERLGDLGLAEAREPPGRYAVQMRVNAETLDARGEAQPSVGALKVFEPPTGPGVRTDTHGYAGYTPNPSFDSLLAKLIVRSEGLDFGRAAARARRALAEFRVEGLATNLPLLDALLASPEFVAGDIHTRFVEENAASFAQVQATEPAPGAFTAPEGLDVATANLSGRLVEVCVAEGDTVRQGGAVAVIEAMKMEHVIAAPVSGVVRQVLAQPGELVERDRPLVLLAPWEASPEEVPQAQDLDPDRVRPDLAAVLARRTLISDEGRPEAVARRRARDQRTARENLADLFDGGQYREYGDFVLAAQRRRRSEEELLRLSPADGLVCGVGAVNGAEAGGAAARCIGMAYDFTVFAGTQGFHNHRKMDRMLDLAATWGSPVVIYAEGGGGRPGETDQSQPHGLDTITFAKWGGLRGRVPRIAVVSGRCFAGNAALAGAADVIIATRDSNLGMGGPAMIEGGGLGVFAPEDIGPSDVQSANGVIDVLVGNEAEATAAVRQYLGYFQGLRSDWSCPDQRTLRHAIPENRLRAYDVRRVIAGLADVESVLELRARFAPGMVTALARIEGRPVGVIANNGMHLGGAIDGPAADKASEFLELCGRFRLPVVSLVDTPGFMVGPEVERTGQVRRASRMFAVMAALPTPVLAVVLRKGYGLGAQAMTGGSFISSAFTVSWPTGEFGGMGLEGAVRLGYRRELEAIADPLERQRRYEALVAESYSRGSALNMAAALEIDAVIDPRETRAWISHGLRMAEGSPRARSTVQF